MIHLFVFLLEIARKKVGTQTTGTGKYEMISFRVAYDKVFPFPEKDENRALVGVT